MYRPIQPASASRIVWGFYREAIDRRQAKKNDIGYDACQGYVDATPAEERDVAVAVGNDEATRAANGQMVNRWLNPEETQPAHQMRFDVGFHVVDKLPEPHRTDCFRALLRPFGFRPAPVLENGDSGMVRGIGCVMKETGEFIHLGSTIPRTDAEIDAALREGEEALAAIQGYMESLREQKRGPLKVAK